MKIAYLIMAHRYPAQLWRMVDRLNVDIQHSVFFIHIDKKSRLHDFTGDFRFPDNVNFIQRREKMYWGEYSQVSATLRLMKEAVICNADYYILLSGQDYPIKSNKEIYDYLSSSEKEFIEYTPMSLEGWAGAMARFQRYYFPTSVISSGLIRHIFAILQRCLPKRPFLKGFIPYGGSQWWCLTHGCIKYVLDFIETNNNIASFFKYTQCPDEMFFQTILVNSSYKDKIINDNLKYIDWSDCAQGKGASPNILTKFDLERLAMSQKLFARKFDEMVDDEILDLIDTSLLI